MQSIGRALGKANQDLDTAITERKQKIKKGGHMETALMKISLIAGIIFFIVLASIAASIISGLAALVITGCVKIVKGTIAYIRG